MLPVIEIAGAYWRRLLCLVITMLSNPRPCLHLHGDVDGMGRCHELTDDEFARLEPLLPPQKPTTGKPNHPQRHSLAVAHGRALA